MAEWNAQTQSWEFTEEELDVMVDEAARRADEEATKRPRLAIVAARFLATERRVLVDLDNGTTFIFPADQIQVLADAPNEHLEKLEVWSENMLAWPTLDAHVPIDDVMIGIFGSKAWMSRMQSERGKKGGAVRSEAKARAARENGKRGGRPRKAAL